MNGEEGPNYIWNGRFYTTVHVGTTGFGHSTRYTIQCSQLSTTEGTLEYLITFMYRRPILCTLYGTVDFLNVLKKGCWWGGGGCVTVLLVHSEIFYCMYL
jgi:hypothetical protein